MLEFKDFRRIRRTYIDLCDESRDECKEMYKKYKKFKENGMMIDPYKQENELQTTMHDDLTYVNGNWVKVVPMPCEFSLAPCATVPEKKKFGFGTCNQKEGINPMNYASASVTTAPTETQVQRSYLESRLYDIYCDKRKPLEALFGLEDDAAPKDNKELAERIKAGKFSIRGIDTDEKVKSYYYWTDMIRWRDPAMKADTEGFGAAKADLKAERQKALDIIKIDDPKAGLDAVKAFEAWEPKGAAN